MPWVVVEITTFDNEHRHPEWAPDCRCGVCHTCLPVVTIPANIELGSE